jgi:hypothetical protein
MNVKQLIEKLETLPDDYRIAVASGPLAAIWKCDREKEIELDYSNTTYTEPDPDGDISLMDNGYRCVFNAFPGRRVGG